MTHVDDATGYLRCDSNTIPTYVEEALKYIFISASNSWNRLDRKTERLAASSRTAPAASQVELIDRDLYKHFYLGLLQIDLYYAKH